MPRVIVIGASRGIGRELARAYAADQWEVLATARDFDDLRQFAGVEGITTAVADMTDERSLNELAAHSGKRHDLLIINAGTNTAERDLNAVDALTWTQVMTTNALGPLLAARALGKAVRDGGKLVALSSAMGSIAANSGGGSYSYRMSKAALNMGLMNLGHELRGRGIAVAALHPGWVKTDMGGEGAPVAVEDSVAGLRRVIDALEAGRTTRFLDYRGNSLAW